MEEIEDLDALCHDVVDYYVREKETLLQPAMNKHMFIACAWTSAEERCLFQLCPFAGPNLNQNKLRTYLVVRHSFKMLTPPPPPDEDGTLQTEMLRNVYDVYRFFFLAGRERQDY